MSSAYYEIKRLCDERGIAVTALEKELGWGRGSIGKMKNAKKNASSDRLQVVADYFGVPLSEITGNAKRIIKPYHIPSHLSNIDLDSVTQVTGLNITKKIPVLGSVAAGVPISAVEDIVGWEEISGGMALVGDYFGLQIQGDSMSPRFCDGDTIIVRQQSDAESGDIVVAMVNDDSAVCKKLRKYEDGSIALISLNSTYSPMFFSPSEISELPVQILGKVIELRARF